MSIKAAILAIILVTMIFIMILATYLHEKSFIFDSSVVVSLAIPVFEPNNPKIVSK